MKTSFKKFTSFIILIVTCQTTFAQWDRVVVNFDKKGVRHGYFEVQDSLQSAYGFGLMISRTENGLVSDLIIEGAAMRSDKIKAQDTIQGFEIENNFISFAELGHEKAMELMKKNDELIFIIKSYALNNIVKVNLHKSNELLRTREYDGVTIKGNFNHGKMHGLWYTYDFKGNLVNTREYKKDKEIKCQGDCTYPPFADYY
ncbi:MAG: hypothetical protein FJX80_10660 [Bacteroidetes bacterium]|nr:hypothetical protein [Bacteroidota bacterium]